ncbi:MAG: hypothetical protein CL534_11610 [Ahrensia sp.]|nr:hypothetical protein [Ahrensia sp.]
MIQLATETTHGELGGVRLAGLRTWLFHFRRRRAFNRMLALDDRMLEDIGVLRAEVEFASRLPLAVNAAIELRRIAHRRRARERGFSFRY